MLKDDANGDITQYRVCYGDTQQSSEMCANYKDVDGVNNTVFNLIGLSENTLYFVAVKATTRAGFGPIGIVLSNRTLEAGK